MPTSRRSPLPSQCTAFNLDPYRRSPIRGQYSGWALDYGQMTRLILRALKECNGAKLITSEIALILTMEFGIVLSKLYEQTSVTITTNLDFAEWGADIRRRQDHLGAAGPAHVPLPHRGDRQRELPRHPGHSRHAQAHQGEGAGHRNAAAMATRRAEQAPRYSCPQPTSADADPEPWVKVQSAVGQI